VIEESRSYHGKYFLTIIFASILLVSFGILVQNVFAMGPGPGSCYNEYVATIVDFKINNGTQIFDPIAHPGLTFQENWHNTYLVTNKVHIANQSSQGNTNPGSWWEGNDYYNFHGQACSDSYVSPNQNVTEGPFGIQDTEGPFTQQQVDVMTVGNSVTYYVQWVPTPTAPVNLSAKGLVPSQINLNWDRNCSYNCDFTNYKIYRSTSSGTETLLTTVGNVLSYNDTQVTNGVTYFYKVTSVSQWGESPQSNEASAMPFADQVVATIPIKSGVDVGVNPNTNTIYVVNPGGYNCQGCAVSVIDGATNSVTNTIMDQSGPIDVGVNPNTNKIYVANFGTHDSSFHVFPGTTVSVIDGATNSVTSTITVKEEPDGIGINPNTNMIYVANRLDNSVSVIDGATNTVEVQYQLELILRVLV